MPCTNQTLYAVWSNAVNFTDSISGTNSLYENVTIGSVLPVPSVTAPDDSYRFLGWYDSSTHTLIDQETYTVQGKGASFEGVWKNLTVEAIAPIYYGFDQLPVNTQISVGFSLSNQGNTSLEGLVAKLTTESPYVTLLQDTVAMRNIPAKTHRTNNSRYATDTQETVSGEGNTFRLVIAPDAPSGTVIPCTLTITDQDGENWTNAVSFTVK